MKVFVYRIGNLGDGIVALPAMRRLQEHFSGAEFVLVTSRPRGASTGCWELYKDIGMFGGVLFYDTGDPKTLFDLARTVRIRGEREFVYLPPFRTAWQVLRDVVFFRFICGFRRAVGLERCIGNPWVGGRIDRTSPVERESTRIDRALAASLGGRFGGTVLGDSRLLGPREKDVRTVESLMGRSPGEKRLIGVGHGSKMPAKRWPTERYRELCRRLLARHPDIRVVLLGDGADIPAGEAIREAAKDRIVNLSGKTSVMESAAALSLCELYVGNDTGTMHLAAAVGVRAVAIFSARDNPGRWDPYGEGHVVIRKKVECAGCMLEACTVHQMKCLDLVTVDEVESAVASALSALARNVTVSPPVGRPS